MIIKGQARGRARQLAAHLLRSDQNESIRLYELRGVLSNDVEGALIEMEARALAARSKQPLYHASISPEPTRPLSERQIAESVETLEHKLGLHGQPRVIVVHVKENRQHVHVVWSRIDATTGSAFSTSWNYRHHEQAARELETRFGHSPVARSRETVQANPRLRTAYDHEHRFAERSGVGFSDLGYELRAIWDGSKTGKEFEAKLKAAGYRLARGDRRVFVVLDRHGHAHSLSRRLKGIGAREIRSRMADVTLSELCSVAETREAMKESPPMPAAIAATTFSRAAIEVTKQQSHERRDNGREMQSHRNVRVMVDVVQYGAPRSMLRHAAGTPATAVQHFHAYRSARAILLAHYAAKIADAFRNPTTSDIAALVAALRSERKAALAALGREQGSTTARPRPVAKRRGIVRRLRKRARKRDQI